MDKNAPEIISAAQTVMITGPLPSADEFAKYEAAKPGTAERILVMAEQEAEHRRKMEKLTVETSIRLNASGQIFGFIIMLLSLGAIFTCILFNQPLIAIPPAILALASLAAVFFRKN